MYLQKYSSCIFKKVQRVLKNVPCVYRKIYNVYYKKLASICKKKLDRGTGLGNELHAESGHAIVSGMSCMFGLDMQLGRVGFHVGVRHGTR